MSSDSRTGMSPQSLAIFVLVVAVLLFILLTVVFKLIEFRDLNAELTKKQNDQTTLADESAGKVTALTSANEKLQSEKAELAEQVKKLEAMTIDLAAAENSLMALTAEKEELQAKLAQATTAEEEATKKVSDLEAALTAQKAEQEKTVQLAGEAEKKVVEELKLTTTQLDGMQKELAAATANIQSLEKQNAELTATRDDLAGTVESLKADLQESAGRLETQTKELADVTAKNDMLTAELEKVGAELAEARKNPPTPPKEELQKLIAAEIKAGNEGTAKELGSLQSSLRSLHEQLEALRASLAPAPKPAAEEENNDAAVEEKPAPENPETAEAETAQ